MCRQGTGSGWSLEVIRGREVGHRFPVPPGMVVLGNAVGNGVGIDLSGQEGKSPRRMAGRQASIELRASGPVLRDLESPGGTFVNRRRLLPGQDQTLQAGDVIQLGGIHLRVVRADSSPIPPRSQGSDRPRATEKSGSYPARPVDPERRPSTATGPMAFTLKDGPTCRSWDDYLTVSAQRWAAMREELTSGRLASYLVSIGRVELAPRADASGSPDERLDAWLGSLPSTRPARPELEVHPRTLAVRGTPGAKVRKSFRVANVGFRLLKTRLRVEPADAGWIGVPQGFSGEFTTVEETEVPIEVELPETIPGRLSASLVLESNGGSARVSVSIEPAALAASGGPPDEMATEVPEGGIGATFGNGLASWLAGRGPRVRVVGGAIVGAGCRLGIGLASGFSGVAMLPGPALLLGIVGAVAGGAWIGHRGGARDVPVGAFAGAFGGLITASLIVSLCQAIEPILGDVGSRNLLAVAALWGLLGASIGGASMRLVPGPDASGRGA